MEGKGDQDSWELNNVLGWKADILMKQNSEGIWLALPAKTKSSGGS